jgi:hypothetical protein
LELLLREVGLIMMMTMEEMSCFATTSLTRNLSKIKNTTSMSETLYVAQ